MKEQIRCADTKRARRWLAVLLIAASSMAQAALQGRDLNGDNVVDAFYDTDLNITWRRNANLNGLMTWAQAAAWADNSTFGGYTDWRLPTTNTPCLGFNCTSSEMGHLWYVELGNLAGDLTPNTGNFVNMQLYAYWSSTLYAQDPSQAWHFNIDQGDQDVAGLQNRLYAMSVRDGDVTAVVPEPGTALLLASLGVLGFVFRRRQR